VTRPSGTRIVSLWLLGVVLALLGGCATLEDARGGPGKRLDPWENWNRKVFAFNEGLDDYVLKPVATGYANVVPRVARQGVDNFFNNFADAWSAINNVLQGKFERAFQDTVRFTTNSTFGIGGLLDIASDFGLEHHYEDFGQTLGVWGFGPGAYVVWPLFGPSTVRDSIALPADSWIASPGLLIYNGNWQTGITLLRIINTRANLLGASRVLDDIALDKYTFVRDAYLQRRRNLVFDGDAPDLLEELEHGEVPDVPPTAEPPDAPASASTPK